MMPKTGLVVLALAALGQTAAIPPIKSDELSVPQPRDFDQTNPRGFVQVQECTVTGCDKNNKRSSNSDRTKPFHLPSKLGDRDTDTQDGKMNGGFVSRGGFQAQECGITGCAMENNRNEIR